MERRRSREEWGVRLNGSIQFWQSPRGIPFEKLILAPLFFLTFHQGKAPMPRRNPLGEVMMTATWLRRAVVSTIAR